MTSLQRHFGSYANLPINPAFVMFPDRSDDEVLPEKDESTENNTDIEKEERKFVSEQRHLIQKSSAEQMSRKNVTAIECDPGDVNSEHSTSEEVALES